jgi:hypothetical protein
VGEAGQKKYEALPALSAQISKITVFRAGTPTPQFEEFQNGELQRLSAVADQVTKVLEDERKAKESVEEEDRETTKKRGNRCKKAS